MSFSTAAYNAQMQRQYENINYYTNLINCILFLKKNVSGWFLVRRPLPEGEAPL